MRTSPNTAAILPTLRSRLLRRLASMPVRLAMTCVRSSLSGPLRSHPCWLLRCRRTRGWHRRGIIRTTALDPDPPSCDLSAGPAMWRCEIGAWSG